MKIGILYFLTIIVANTLGALSGMGGGVIIKPVLDFIGADTVSTISFYSAVAVFTMSSVSTFNRLRDKVLFNWRMIGCISFGAVLGGNLGNIVFERTLQILKQDAVVNQVQIVLTMVTLIVSFLYSKFEWKKLKLCNVFWYACCGMILGFLASFLSIGGGPINVSLLIFLFSMSIKEATIYSIAIILFSQASKILTIVATGSLMQYNLGMMLFIIPAAILGGVIGTRVSKILSPKSVTYVFQGVIIIVLLLNVYNAVQLFF